MKEQEIIQRAKENFLVLETIPRELISKNVIDNIQICNNSSYHKVLNGVLPENISKKIALKLLMYDKEVYGLLTKELQEDKDILKITTKQLENLPQSLFSNKVAINYILDKCNVKYVSWALYGVSKDYLIIKPNINKNQYYLYVKGLNRGDSSKYLPKDFRTANTNSIYAEAIEVTYILSDFRLPIEHRFVNHLK